MYFQSFWSFVFAFALDVSAGGVTQVNSLIVVNSSSVPRLQREYRLSFDTSNISGHTTSYEVLKKEVRSSATSHASSATSTFQASLKSSFAFGNVSLPSQASSPTAVCCFLVQDTVTEMYWPQTVPSTLVELITLTSITTYVYQTDSLDVMSTEVVTNIYPMDTSYVGVTTLDRNPLYLAMNNAPMPSETSYMINATTTSIGDVVVQSPAAFYVYNTVKIITVNPATMINGQPICATPSATSFHNQTFQFPSMNANAEAYFGGLLGIATQTDTRSTVEVMDTFTFTLSLASSTVTRTDTETVLIATASAVYLDSAGDIITKHEPTPTGTIISLTTPFVWQPPRGSDGSVIEPCGDQAVENSHTEDYGYIPQTLLDDLINNPYYSSQYTGLANCIPGGPSIIPRTCITGAVFTTSTQSGSIVLTALGGDLTQSTTLYATPPGIAHSVPPEMTTETEHSKQTLHAQSTKPLENSIGLTIQPGTKSPSSMDAPPYTVPQKTDLGVVVTTFPSPSRVDSPPPQVTASHLLPPPRKPVTIPSGGMTMPIAAAPPGAVGKSTDIGGTAFIVIPSATTIYPAPDQVIFPATIIPLSLAQAGPAGTTTTINGTPFLVVPEYTTTYGTPYFGIVEPTSNANTGNSGLFATTTINGMPYLDIPSPTSIPLSLAPPGLEGSMTLINGTPYLSVPSATLVPDKTPPSTISPPGARVTVISGTTDLIITGPTTIPFDPAYSIPGSTTVISGTTMVVVTGVETVPIASTTGRVGGLGLGNGFSMGGLNSGSGVTTTSSTTFSSGIPTNEKKTNGAAQLGISGELLWMNLLIGTLCVLVFVS